MSIHCMICGHPENWCEGKEYSFDDTVRIDIIDEFAEKKRKNWSRYAHARCILKMLAKACSDYTSYDSLNPEDDFYELKLMIKEIKKEQKEDS